MIFHSKTPVPPFSWINRDVRVRIAVGDSESSYAGVLSRITDDGVVLACTNLEVFIPLASVVSIELEQGRQSP